MVPMTPAKMLASMEDDVGTRDEWANSMQRLITKPTLHRKDRFAFTMGMLVNGLSPRKLAQYCIVSEILRDTKHGYAHMAQLLIDHKMGKLARYESYSWRTTRELKFAPQGVKLGIWREGAPAHYNVKEAVGAPVWASKCEFTDELGCNTLVPEALEHDVAILALRAMMGSPFTRRYHERLAHLGGLF